VWGELCIAGAGLARGYLGRPALTAERFVPDPFGGLTAPGGRLYRTGDLARWLPTGEVELAGRVDRQVKLRGHRIEPGELEAALARHPAVAEAAVVARDDLPGGAGLAAYVVAAPDGPDLDPASLRRHLAARLPAYMLPQAFAVLPALPRTASGKLDRRSLPVPAEAAAGRPARDRLPPRDALELALCRIWEELLGRPVGVADDFFGAGGHSLLGLRLLARVRDELGRELPAAVLFQAPTVAGMAAVLRGRVEVGSTPLVPIRPSGSGPPLVLVHPVGGGVACYLELARALPPEVPVYGLQAPHHDAPATVEGLAERYAEALLELLPEGPVRLGGWSLGGAVALETARRLEARGRPVERLLLLDARPPGAAPPLSEGDLLGAFAHDLLGLAGGGAPDGVEAALDPSAGFTALLEDARARGLVPADLPEEGVRELFETFRRNLRAVEAYRGGPLRAPAVLFRAAEAPPNGQDGPPDLGWGRLLGAGLEVREVPGDHYSILAAPGVETLAAAIAEALESPPESDEIAPSCHAFSPSRDQESKGPTPKWTTRAQLACHRGLGALRQASSRLAEREVARGFRAFQEGLTGRRDPIYMFFTGGLLHWVARALSFVPEGVELVLVGSDLSDEEAAWLRERCPRPFHRIGPRVDDNTVLELLFETATRDFGWLHIDCFVLTPGLFAEMTDLPGDAALNCVWTHPGVDGGPATLHSAFVFVSHAVLAEVRERRLRVRPTAYSYRGTSVGRTVTGRRLWSRVPTARQVELLGRVLPPGPDGLPAYPGGAGYFQVLVLYQLVARALGYRTRQVRPLVRDGSGSMEHYSGEIVHVNGVATYRRYRDADGSLGQRVYPLLLQADWAMLEALGPDAPARYRALRAELEVELERLGVPPSRVKGNLEGFLTDRGLAPEVSARILG
jgi:thioesterase domain-containing protein